MKKKFLILIISIVIAVLLIGGSIFYAGSTFFIKRNFNQAFIYRVSGDCDSFVNYFSRGNERWKERCEEEKRRDKEPIRNFEIQNISRKFGSDRAFLQVELTRKIEEKDYSYSVSYEMRRYGFTWKIDQELK